MSLGLVIAIALLTYGSRAAALVLMPDPPRRVKTILDRIPAPLFASLGAMSLIDDGDVASPQTLCAASGALIATRPRSLLWVLVGGLTGYTIGELLFG